MELVVAPPGVAKSLGLAEATRIGVAEGHQGLPIGKNPIQSVVGIAVKGVASFAALPDAVNALDASPDGLRRVIRTRKMLHQPIKKDFAVIFSLDIFFPGPQSRSHFFWDVEGAIMSKNPSAMRKRLRMRRADELMAR